MQTFKIDLETIRQRARDKMHDGAVTGAYKADREKVIEVLNEALATELTCVLRYKNHYFMAEGLHGEVAAEEFLEHAKEEQEHADTIAERIVQLGGTPEMDPKGLHTKAHAEYVEGGALLEMVKENLVAERIAVETYTEIVRWLGDADPTTRRMIEGILDTEEEHADDMAGLLERIGAEEATA
jgi:bacterioferritin